MNRIRYFFIFLIFIACSKDDAPTMQPGILQLTAIRVGTVDLDLTQVVEQIPIDKGIIISFSLPLDKQSAENAISLKDDVENLVNLSFSYLDNDKTIVVTPSADLLNNTVYQIDITNVNSTTGEVFTDAVFRFQTKVGTFQLVSASINGADIMSTARVQNVPTSFSVEAVFSEPLQFDLKFDDFVKINTLDLDFQLSEENKKLTVTALEASYLKRYLLDISPSLTSEQGFAFNGFNKEFYTQLDSAFKFPEISDEELLTKVQEQTFKYFWDFGHPVSGLARERNTSGELVTTGGSGFGVMAILVAIQRGFITRAEGIGRLETIVNFLKDADRFHGVWPHWMNGTTGKVIPFSADDDGGDLVETAFMIHGLLTVRQYLNNTNSQEAAIMTSITQLWEEVEWDWYTQGGQDVLYWHWSPNFGWQKNHQIRGWNEALIIYVLAASSPTHPVSADVYHQGWARGGDMVNGSDFYNINLPLGSDRGGPLFFSHYSFLGLDPRNLEDQYANYWTQNVNHSLINREYCISNSLDYVGYSSACWGLTASDNNTGYSAHSPNNDIGVITPTAAISSIPYTPQESMEAIRHFYYLLGDKLWGEYGFYDAFNLTAGWTANSYLAIDQGPIIVMIENHRTGLLWDQFMSDPDVQSGLQKLGFTY